MFPNIFKFRSEHYTKDNAHKLGDLNHFLYYARVRVVHMLKGLRLQVAYLKAGLLVRRQYASCSSWDRPTRLSFKWFSPFLRQMLRLYPNFTFPSCFSWGTVATTKFGRNKADIPFNYVPVLHNHRRVHVLPLWLVQFPVRSSSK